jgi:hypothetical protein
LGDSKTPAEMTKFIHDSGLQYCMPELYKLLCVAVTLPVTSATVERSFSVLKRIKNYTRNTIGQDRLNNMAQIAIEKDLVDNDSEQFLEDVVDHFAQQKNRRIPLVFNQPGQIDLLIGSALFWKLLSIGQIHVNQSGTIIEKTKLRWIVSGPIPQINSNSVCNVSKISSLDSQLKRFWEINESYNLTNHSNTDDELCEQMFEKTTQRDPLFGRFTVKLPFRNNPPNLGHSRELAIKRFKFLENNFF